MPAQKIVYNYEEMATAVQKINEIAASYRTLAATFCKDMDEATTGWEGDSRVAMMNFIKGSVFDYIGKTVPQLVESFAQLLDQNAKQMGNADTQVAQSIQSTSNIQNSAS